MGVLVARQLFATLGRRRRALEALGLALLGFTLLLTFTRGALLGGLAGVAACMALAPWRWRLASVSALGLAAALVATQPAVRERVRSMGDREASDIRALIWSQGVRIIADHPLGVGLGNYTPVVGRYYDLVEPQFQTRTYPHNVLLAAWAETGPVGLVGYAWGWMALGVACLRRLRAAGADRDVAAAALFGVAAFWTVGMTHDVLYHNAVGLAYTGLVGLTLALWVHPHGGGGAVRLDDVMAAGI
jgi:O-antigen ligase